VICGSAPAGVVATRSSPTHFFDRAAGLVKFPFGPLAGGLAGQAVLILVARLQPDLRRVHG